MLPDRSRLRLAAAAGLGLAAAAAGAQEALLVDVTAAAGIEVAHVNGMRGELYFVEMMGSGIALFDADNDGDLDLFVVQGHPLGPQFQPDSSSLTLRDRLLRNDLSAANDGAASLRFSDVTAASGIEAERVGYGMGVATGDFDDDGWVDLYVTNWGPNVLWRNRGDGTFEDVTARAGVGDPGWSTSASFVDFDGDGRLDLFVADYVEYGYGTHQACFARTGAPDYCGPTTYRPTADRLYRNRGDGTFQPVVLDLAHTPVGAGLGVVSGDFDGDGRLDLYVANDQSENHLWLHRTDRLLGNAALLTGVAVNLEGRPEASMGVDAADFDNDGDEDLFLTHLAIETNTLYLSAGNGAFDDVTVASGLGAPSFALTGFGTGWFDLDADNRLDLFVANGAVKLIGSQVAAGEPLPLRQPNQLFRNRGDGGFEDLGPQAGPALAVSDVSRGVAFGDVDNDGDVDLVVANNNGPLRLLANQAPRRHTDWVGLTPVGGPGGRPMLGARVEFALSSGETIVRRARSDGSYASARDPRVRIAVPDGVSVESVGVRWPGGAFERFPPPPLNRYSALREGGGTHISP